MLQLKVDQSCDLILNTRFSVTFFFFIYFFLFSVIFAFVCIGWVFLCACFCICMCECLYIHIDVHICNIYMCSQLQTCIYMKTCSHIQICILKCIMDEMCQCEHFYIFTVVQIKALQIILVCNTVCGILISLSH